MPKIVDSHAHLTSDQLYGEVDEILARAQQAGVGRIINICTDIKTLERGIELHKRYPWVFNAAATTPHDAASEGDEVFPVMERAARNGDLVAIGETGLEYFYTPETQKEQIALLTSYFHLALETKLPVIIHCRDAFDDFFKILDEEYVEEGAHGPGVLHCFTGTVLEAEKVVNRGWYLSLSGIVTYKKSAELREVAKMVPLNRILIETDSPYLAPQSKRGKQNEPSFITETAKVIAEVKGLSLEELIASTAENALNLFVSLK